MEESGKVLKFISSFIFKRVDELCLCFIINYEYIAHGTNFNTVYCILCHIMYYVGPTVINKYQEHGQNVI